MVLFWFRRDLRIDDNTGLYHALQEKNEVQCVFIFDTDILERLEDKNDGRVTFIYQEVKKLATHLEQMGASLRIFHGKPFTVFQQIIKAEKIEKVYANEDYEPDALTRDEAIGKLLHSENIELVLKKTR